MRLRKYQWSAVTFSVGLFIWPQSLPAPTAALSQPAQLDYSLGQNFLHIPPDSNFGEVAAVAVDRRDHLYVFNRGPKPLIEFDANGRFLRELAKGLITHAHGLRVDRAGHLWLVDDLDHHVIKLDSRGRVVMVLGRRGRAGETKDLFNRPTDVAVNSRGEIYVADGYVNSRIVKFSPDGRFIVAWGSKGTGPGQFNVPHAVVIDTHDRLYVADRENHRIEVFDADGHFLAQWSGFNYPQGLVLSADGSLYVGDNTRVVKLNDRGRVIGVFGTEGRAPGQFMGLHGLAVTRNDQLFTAELLNWRVQKWVRIKTRKARRSVRPR